MITSKQIREALIEQWPNLGAGDTRIGYPPLIVDRQFMEVDIEELSQVLLDHKDWFEKEFPLQKVEVSLDDIFSNRIQENRDCDDWAVQSMCYVRKYYYQKYKIKVTPAYFICLGLKFGGVSKNHTKNWCWSRSEGGIYLAEASIPNITEPTKGDEIWFATTI